jgi:hypothetical protein
VDFSSDTFPGFLTTREVNDARLQGLVPPRRGGYFNWYGPDGVVMETADGGPEAYRIVGMFQEQPYCAVLWYRHHLNAGDLPSTADVGADGTRAEFGRDVGLPRFRGELALHLQAWTLPGAFRTIGVLRRRATALI